MGILRRKPRRPVVLPGDAARAAAPPSDERTVVPLQPCPFCLKEVSALAADCPKCRKRILGAGSPAEFRKRLLLQELALRQAIRDGKLDTARGGLLGTWRPRTLLVLGVAVACLIAIMLGGNDPELARLAVLAMQGLFVSLALLVYCITGDMFLFVVRRRRRPADALAAFERALEIERFEAARDCVLPSDRNDRPRLRRGIQALGLGSCSSSFADLAGFRAYWQPVFTVPHKRPGMSRPKVLRAEGVFALVAATLAVSRKSAGWGGPFGALSLSVDDDSEDIRLKKLVRRVNDRWYLVNGEMHSPEDHALNEFAVLAAASDEQLMGLCQQVLETPVAKAAADGAGEVVG